MANRISTCAKRESELAVGEHRMAGAGRDHSLAKYPRARRQTEENGISAVSGRETAKNDRSDRIDAGIGCLERGFMSKTAEELALLGREWADKHTKRDYNGMDAVFAGLDKDERHRAEMMGQRLSLGLSIGLKLPLPEEAAAKKAKPTKPARKKAATKKEKDREPDFGPPD